VNGQRNPWAQSEKAARSTPAVITVSARNSECAGHVIVSAGFYHLWGEHGLAMWERAGVTSGNRQNGFSPALRRWPWLREAPSRHRRPLFLCMRTDLAMALTLVADLLTDWAGGALCSGRPQLA
jgi:hypothetical protein